MRAVKRSLDSDEDLQLKPYSHYKPSAVKWLDDVPHHWEVRRFGTLAQGFNNGITADQLEIGESNHLVSRIETISKGAIDYTRVGYLAEGSDHQAYLLEEHDFLISHINSYARVGNSARHRGERPLIHGMNLIRITPFNAVVPSYLEYLLKSDVFIGAMRRVCKPAINQVSVTTTAIKAIRLPLPPLHEQAAIVRYLDHADRRIRRYVDAKRKLIALLEEEKQAIVNQAVTRGLDPNVPLKPSGVDWLGDVPEHWQVEKIKKLARSDHKSFVDGDWIESPYITSDGIRLIQTGNIGIGEYREKGFRYISEETFKDFTCTEVQTGDVLICRLGEPVARACLAPQLGKRMITSVDVCILKPRDGVNAQLVVYCMSSRQYLDWVGSLVRGSTRDPNQPVDAWYVSNSPPTAP